MNGPPDTFSAAPNDDQPSLKPTFCEMCAGIIGLKRLFQSPNGFEKTTVTVLPPFEPVTDWIWL